MSTASLLVQTLTDIDFLHVYTQWQNLARDYSCFVHSTSFATLKNYQDFALEEVSTDMNSSIETIIHYIKPYCDSHTLFFIDLPVASALRYAYCFNKELGMLPVLTVRHLSHPYGLVGNKQSINAMLSYVDYISDTDVNPPSYLFILDSDRHASYTDDVYKIQFNNQYELTAYDLPSVEMLRKNKIEKAVFLYDKSLKPDIHTYRDLLQTHHFEILDFDLVSAE